MTTVRRPFYICFLTLILVVGGRDAGEGRSGNSTVAPIEISQVAVDLEPVPKVLPASKIAASVVEIVVPSSDYSNVVAVDYCEAVIVDDAAEKSDGQ